MQLTCTEGGAPLHPGSVVVMDASLNHANSLNNGVRVAKEEGCHATASWWLEVRARVSDLIAVCRDAQKSLIYRSRPLSDHPLSIT